MKQLLLLSMGIFLNGCVGTATVVSCAANSDQYPEKERYNLLVSATIETQTGKDSKSIPMQCLYKERRCGGGDWYFKWNEIRDQDLTFNLGAGKSLSVGIPNCTMALNHLGKNYTYGKSLILSKGQKFTIGNKELSQTEAKSVLGIQLLSVSIAEAENEE